MTQHLTKTLIAIAILSTAGSWGVVQLLPGSAGENEIERDLGFNSLRGIQSRAQSTSYISPIPSVEPSDDAVVALGKRLFNDPSLSSDGTISCASCHHLAEGGDDGRALSVGVGGLLGERNAPTVLNCRFNALQFWDGRVRTLEEQVDGPILNELEMGMTWDGVVAVLESDPTYVSAFQEALQSAPSPAGVRTAIATFERTLVTPASPFDRHLRGEPNAVSEEALRGYETFVQVGCITCHQGVNVGGNMMQPLGRMQNYFGGEEASSDVAFDSAPLFRAPSLRNVARTAPYFHDGSISSLTEAVQIMGRYQLGVLLEEGQVSDIVSFLEALSGELRTREER